MAQGKIAIVAGVGAGLGAALCRGLWGAGYQVAALARSEEVTGPLAAEAAAQGGVLRPVRCDLRDEAGIAAAFREIEAWEGAIEVYIHNAGHFVMGDFLRTPGAEHEKAWRLACLAAVHFSQRVLPGMVARGRGVLLFSGATASRRGGAQFSAFAAAKFALRGLAQSLAREFGPQGIHVAHVIVDGIIDCQWTRRRFGVAPARMLHPEDVAENYLHLIAQPPSAWTQELDLRPCTERF